MQQQNDSNVEKWRKDLRSPISGGIIVTNKFGTAGYGTFGRHAGVDIRAAVGTNLYAPGDGVVNEAYIDSKGNKVVGLAIGSHWWRFLHLNDYNVRVGQHVKEGQLIGHTGNSGGVAAHLHVDVRTPGTAWNASFDNYLDPMKLITPSQPAGDEMIDTSDDATKLYKMLRPNGTASAQEILGTTGRRSYKEFVATAQAEVRARDSGIKELENKYTAANNKITELETLLIQRTADLNAVHLQLLNVKRDLEQKPEESKTDEPAPVVEVIKVKKPPVLIRLIAAVLRRKEVKK